MKIFINTTNWAIVKTENEFPSVVGDNYVDTLKVYYDVNPSTALIYPTITLLKPNGRKVGAFPFDAGTVENPVPFAYTDADSNTWYGFAFTLSSDDGQLTSVGRYQVTITTNKYKVVGTAPDESQVITNQRNTNIQLEVMNAVLNDNSDILILGESVDDVVASMYQLCQTLELDFASLTNSKADRSNDSQTILARLLKASNIEAQTTSGILTIGRSYADISIKSDEDNRTGSFINITSENDVNVNAGEEVNINGTTIDLVSAGEEDNAEIYMNNEAVTISGYQTTINHLRVMQPDGLGGDITVSGNNATEVFTNDGLNIQSKTKIGNTSGDYWQFYGDTLSLKGSSHTIESNSGDASITFDDDVLEIDAEEKVQVNAPTVNVEADTIVLGDEPTAGGGGVEPILVVEPSSAVAVPSCLKVISNATGSNAVVQVKTDTDKIPFEITKDGNIKYTKVQSGTTYNIFANGSIINFTKTPSGGSLSTLMVLDTEQGLIVKNDLLDVDPSQYMVNNVTPFRVGIKTGGTGESTTGTYVQFNRTGSRIDFKTTDTQSDLIYMNGVKLTNKTYVDTADNNLQSQIDGLNAGQNLADIVADITALNNLDITNLKNGDKVQVLVDSNHDNASTVYSLVINGSSHSWSYIGKYGQDGYTKAEDNALLALKADKSTTYTKTESDAKYVNLTGTQTISGIKTFTNTTYWSVEDDSNHRGQMNVSADYLDITYFKDSSLDNYVQKTTNAHNLYDTSSIVNYTNETTTRRNQYSNQIVDEFEFDGGYSKQKIDNAGVYGLYNVSNSDGYTTIKEGIFNYPYTEYEARSTSGGYYVDAIVKTNYNGFEAYHRNKTSENYGKLIVYNDYVKIQVSNEDDSENAKALILTQTNGLTLNGNKVIDTANATTELFLTDGEMNELLSEVFD